MNNIAIVTDTTSDIPEAMAKENEITIVPLYVGYEGKLYKEEKEITSSDVYKKLEAGTKVYTSAPSTGDFAEAYRNLIENEEKTIIYSIHLSSKLSGTFNSASQAKKFFPRTKIKVIDSKNVTISLGFIVLEAARAAKSRANEEEIDSLIEFLTKRSKFFAILENFEYVFRGGRVPFLGKFLSKSVIFTPILTIDRNGNIKLKKFVRNKRNAIIELYKQIKKETSYTGKKKIGKIGIFYGSDINTALEIEKMVRDDNDIKFDELILTEITTIMSAHTGPGIWGIASCPKVGY